MTTRQLPDKPKEPPSQCEYLTLVFSPTNAPLRARWRNNGLSADFLGDYVTTFLPAWDGVTTSENRLNEIRHAVTYIANELLENAMKYHEHAVDIPIKIHLELRREHITVSVSNGIGDGQKERYQAFVERLQEKDAGDLLAEQQEESAKQNESTVSCLGLLTMIADYDAQLDWRFEADPGQSGTMMVTTIAVLPLRGVMGASA
jgi:hypothetical protein